MEPSLALLSVNMTLSESDSGSDGDSNKLELSELHEENSWLAQAVAWHWISYVEHKASHGISNLIV